MGNDGLRQGGERGVGLKKIPERTLFILAAAAVTALLGAAACGKESPSPPVSAGPSPGQTPEVRGEIPPGYAARGIKPRPARFWEKAP